MTAEDIREFRRDLGMNQNQFWSRLSVTQSGGSRYEAGRQIPKPVQKLITLTYGTDAESAKELATLRKWKNPEDSGVEVRTTS